MKEIKFEQLTIKNFLSFGSEEFVLNIKPGLYIITGDNLDKPDSRNGVGKSSIPDAFYYSLFGKTLRDINIKEIINEVNQKNLEVTNKFVVSDGNEKKNYLITRGVKPDSFSFTEDGEDITRSKGDSTKHICKILNSTPELFPNSVTMSLSNTVPFMAQKKVERRKFVEGVFNLSFLGEMLKIARQDYNEQKKKYDIETTKVDEIENSLKIYKEQQAKFEENKKNKIKELTDRLKTKMDEITKLKEQLITIDDEKVTNCNAKIKKIDTAIKFKREEKDKILLTISGLKSDFRINSNRIKEIEGLGDVCFNCKQPWPAEKQTQNKTEIKRLQEENNKIETKISDKIQEQKDKENSIEQFEVAKKKLEKELQDIDIQKTANSGVKQQINDLVKIGKQIGEDLDKARLEENDFDELVKTNQTKLDKIKTDLKDMSVQLDVLNTVKFIASDEGIKGYIIKKKLKSLNSHLRYYLSSLQVPCKCEFDEYFDAILTNERGQERSYYSFSSGEQRRIDLAMLLTFMDFNRHQNQISINTSFYDELLDSSLDQIGIHLFIRVLRERVDKYKEAIFLITHRKKVTQSNLIDGVIYLQKENGITKELKNGI